MTSLHRHYHLRQRQTRESCRFKTTCSCSVRGVWRHDSLSNTILPGTLKGLLQKRLEKNLCWILCQVPLVTQTVTGLNWTEMKLWIWQTKIQLSLSSSHHNTVALSPAWQHQQGHFPGSSMTYMTCGALLQKHAWIVLTTPWHHPQPCSSPQGHPPGRPTWPEGCCPWQDVGPAPGSWSPGSYDIWQGQHLPTQKQDAFLD